MARKLFWAIWKRWLALDIHLDQSSLLRKQWSPMRWVPRGEGKAFVESTSWWAACLVREVTLLSLWNSVTNLWLEGLDLFSSLDILYDCVKKESSCFAATLSTYFCWIEGALAEAVVAAVSFCSPFEQIVEKMNFLVWTLQHCLGGAVVGTTSGIL